MIKQGIEALGNTRRPFGIVGDFRRVSHGAVGSVTLNTYFLENLLAGTHADRSAVAHDHIAGRHNAGCSGRFGGRVYIAVIAAGSELDQKIQSCQQNDDAADKGNGGRAAGALIRQMNHG